MFKTFLTFLALRLGLRGADLHAGLGEMSIPQDQLLAAVRQVRADARGRARTPADEWSGGSCSVIAKQPRIGVRASILSVSICIDVNSR